MWKAGESGQRYTLTELQSSCPQALYPYDGVAGFSSHTHSFNGQTLFRFPLRNKPSNLSSEVSTIDSVRQLLHALKDEAKFLLLFLRSVCSIEVIEIEDTHKQQTSFKVSISSCDALLHKQQQQSLVKQVETTFTGSYPYSIECIIQQSHKFSIELYNNGVVTEHEWLVVHRVGSEDKEVLALAQQQHVLPWVGTAVEIGKECDRSSSGRVFCCIPLPTEDRAPFNVCVNGTFAVSSNRRSLNWESQERQGDSEGLWNKYLVEKCLPQCYCELIQQVLKIPSISPETVYQCWPVTHHVKQTPWAGLLKPLFVKLLYSKSVVHANPSDWISLSNAALVPNGTTLPDSVQVLLVSLGLRVVTLTAEQWNIINEYYSNELHTITPCLVRGLMRENDRSYSNYSFSRKIELLQYCLSDRSYSDLSDLELIPVANGTFSKFNSPIRMVYSYFSSHSDPPAYVCTSSIRHDLLPGVDNVMVDLLDNDATTHGLLLEVARSNRTQLSVVNESVIAKLVPQSDPQSWSQSQFERFWKWLRNYNLKAFKGLQIVPVKQINGRLSIYKLTKQSSLVFVSRYASKMDLTANLRSALEQFGVDLACEYEFPYMNHSQLSSCINQFVVGEVVDCTQLHAIRCSQLTDQEASEMQIFLFKCQINIERIHKICEMSIFSVIQDDSNRFSVNQVKTREQGNVALAQGKNFLFRTDLLPKHPMIFKSGQSLLQKLTNHVLIINGIECLEKVVFLSIRNSSLPVESIIKFMLSVLDNLRALVRYANQRKSLLNALSSLPFVLVESEHLVSPSSLFDPRDQLLVQMYQTENVFPYDAFLEYIDELVLCGLKNSKSVTASMMNDILNKSSVHCGWYDEEIIKCDTTTISRVNGFFKFLTKYPHLLNDPIGGYRSILLKESILQRATSYALFPVASSKPVYYPSSLNWMGSEHSNSLVKYDSSQVIVLPNTVNHHCCPDPTIIGSKVIFVENIPQLLCSHVPKINLVNCVLKHFQHVIDNESNLDSDTLEQIALKTYEYLNSTSIGSVVNVVSVGKLIWIENRSKFVEPHLCVLNNNTLFNNNLEPFLYILPRKIRKYEDLFCRFGVSRLLQHEQIVSVLTSIKANCKNISSNEAWTIVKSILDWLVATKVVSDNVLVPITCDDDNSYPDLHPVSEVCYTDNEMLLEIAQSSNEEYKLVHPSIAHLASQLGLTPLSDQLDITEEVFQDAGQHEPLTTRLSNILRDYKDGLTIIKELVQNADDAEATEVNILYDGRQHTTDKLLFKGMAASHGPALVVHNNATFTEDDFDNITKLAGATKKDKPLKIGKFGVGFCSVYHITDVPSFVSGEWLYIFDPTLNHLKGVVKNVNQPGKRVKHSSKFISKSKQLVPYENLFQFSPSETYNGTMFRFPFRTHASQISSTIYTKSMIDALKNDIADSGKKMLLFLSHVKKLNFLTIQAGSSSTREEIVIEKIECGGNIVRIETKVSTRSSNPIVEYWLVSTVSKSVYDVYEKKSIPSVSSVACQLCMPTDGKYKVVPVDGSVFCYLPLSVPCTGLPVHISANFAVMSNRSGIWTSSSSATPSDSREWWNQQLMETIIPEAYCNLLVMLKSLRDKRILLDYNFFELFPLISELKVHHPWKTMIENMYSKVLQKKLLFCKCLGKWLHLNECQFLSHDVLSLSENDVAKCVVDSVQVMKLPIVDIPKNYLQQFQLTSNVNMIDEETFCEMFFAMISRFSENFKLRNEVLYNMYLVASSDHNMHGESNIVDMLIHNPSVPCTPHGINLKLASSLIDPHCELKQLFDSDSEMFPCQLFTDSKPVHQLMIDIGLLNTTLPWDIIVECAKSIETVYTQDKNKALKRIKVILKCLGHKLTEDKISNSKKLECLPSEDFIRILKEIKFIPVASRPDNFISLWKGKGVSLSSPRNMFYPHPSSTGYFSERQYNIRKACSLLGSQKVIVNNFSFESGGCGSIPHSVVVALGFQCKPNVDDVVANFTCLLQQSEIEERCLNEKKIVDQISYMCRISYEFLENELKMNSEISSTSELMMKECQTISRFRDQPFIWIEGKFVSPQNIATRWKEKGPYLYELPSILSERKLLIQALCIKENFTIKKLLKTLQVIHDDCGEKKVNKNCLNTIMAIINELNSYKPDDYKDIDKDNVILPSASCELLQANCLSFNDSQWLPVNDDCILVHPILTRAVALALGVNPVRSQFLDKYVSSGAQFGSEFGQREELTQRIKNILRDYPLDVTLIKELLQNADDAKATKMCVILDKRQHGTERIPSKEWSELQGPALLVWNDEEFTQKDLEGIQKLGLGSKRDDSESIGQFGIGFNVVYHVTDCPSLITGGKTLCVFDPHCKYVPGANPLNPGRRYDDLENTFWNVMSDLKSAYCQCDPITSQPSDIDKGSLFRLPLRNIAMESKIEAKALTVSYLENELNNWVLQIKDALIFLNHISEFSYYVVDRSGFHLRYQYKIEMDSNAVNCRQSFFRASKEFKLVQKPCIVNYQISMDCMQPNTVPSDGTAIRSPVVSSTIPQHLKSHEEWFIQQGIGDVNKNASQQKWRFIDRVFPKHGIASPINQTSYFKGKIFCFLPLPGESGLPVHINGQFVLSSNRRSLWTGDPESNDEKKEWNDNLMEAIASSYVHYLTEARHVFVEDREFTDFKILHQSIINYYRLFQNFEGTLTFNNSSGLNFAQLVIKNLWKLNPKILALELSRKVKHNKFVFKVDWNNLIEEKNPFNQYYFQPICEDKKEIISLLNTLKMKLTCAPNFLYKNLIFDQKIPAIATPASVFDFYCRFHHLILSHASPPCKLTETPHKLSQTPFRNLETFLAFVNYLLVESDIHEKVFPKSPFGCPLLLTEDLVLRYFGTEPTIMRTRFANIFPNSLSAFVHNAILSLDLSSSYFVNSSEIALTRIDELLVKNYSIKLKQKICYNNGQCVIELEKLKNIWNCLTSQDDRFLQNFYQQILRSWALLPAKDGRLFTTQNPILPMQLEESLLNNHENFRQILQILKQVGFPELDAKLLPVAAIANQILPIPSINNYDQILTMLYHLQSETRVLDNLTSNDSEHLLSYLSRTSFRSNTELKDQLMTLPLFKTTTGSLTSLSSKKVYLWPSHEFCVAGFTTWAPPEAVVFLHVLGNWKLLKTDFNEIGSDIDELGIYSRLIIPKFQELSSDERYQHMEYLRDFIHPTLKKDVADKFHKDKNQIAKEFLQQLKSLKCITHANTNEVETVGYFCDNTISIFKMFPDSFNFLPVKYQVKEWLEYLCYLGLQTKVSADDFVPFCHIVENGEHGNPSTASQVLVEYLFTEGQEWDNSYLNQIAEIRFVQVAEFPSVTWIKASCSPPLLLQNSRVGLTSFKEGVVSDQANIIWTVKPVFELSHWYCFSITHEFFETLQITTTPTPEDVLQNLINMSKSGFSNSDLFFKYNPQYIFKESATHIIDIFSKSVSFLWEHNPSLLPQLKTYACIPVSVDHDRHDKPDKVVLVKPISVVMQFNQPEDMFLKPYVHELPTCLKNRLEIFHAIGVLKAIDLVHIQHVLKSLYQNIGTNILDPNQVKAIRYCILKISNLISSNKVVVVDSLSPLYLPSKTGSSWTLHKSTDLVFADSIRYTANEVQKFNFMIAGYFLFNIPQDHTSNIMLQSSYLKQLSIPPDERSFCCSLPKQLRPLELSFLTVEKKLPVGNKSQKKNILEFSLLQMLEFLDPLESIFTKMVEQHLKYETQILPTTVVSCIMSFLQTLEVIVINGLQASVTLNGNEIGSLSAPTFVLDKHDDHYILYISEAARHHDCSLTELSHFILMEIARILDKNVTTFSVLIEPFKKCLQIQSNVSLKGLAETYGLQVGSVEVKNKDETESSKDDLSKPTPGKVMPLEFVRRLDRSIDNVYLPEEWVGYEVTEQNFVWAIILEQKDHTDKNSTVTKEYMILSSIDDIKGHLVSALDLYKIMPLHMDIKNQESKEVVLYDKKNTSTTASNLKERLGVIQLKKRICEELEMLRGLTSDKQQKGIRRLYIKYHPDKCHKGEEEVYEEVFKFLLRQIDLLEEGSPLENPETESSREANYTASETESSFQAHYTPSSAWSSFYDRWNEQVPTHDYGRGHKSSNYFFEQFQSRPSPTIAKHWLKQARADSVAMRVLKNDRSHVCQVIFLAHEVVEKSLKAGMHGLLGLNMLNLANHNLRYFAESIHLVAQNDSYISLVEIADRLSPYYESSRYPDKHMNLRAPVDVYELHEAEEAAELAMIALEFIESKIN